MVSVVQKKMTPFEMSFKSAIPNNKMPKFHAALPKFQKFQVGDFVGVPDKRSVYSKSYTTNWNREQI